MVMCGVLQWERAAPRIAFEGSGVRGQGAEAGCGGSDSADNPQSAIAPIIIEASPTLHPSFFTLHSPLGGFLFSYTVAALIVGLGLLIGWACKVSYQAAEKAEYAAEGGKSGGKFRRFRNAIGDRSRRRPLVRWKGPWSAKSPARPTANGPRGQWTVDSGQWAVNPKSEIRTFSCRLAQIQRDFRLDGNHLRQWGEGHS